MADKDSIPKDPYDVELPQSVIDSLAHFLLPEIRKFYNNEQGQNDFSEWQKRQKGNTD